MVWFAGEHCSPAKREIIVKFDITNNKIIEKFAKRIK